MDSGPPGQKHTEPQRAKVRRRVRSSFKLKKHFEAPCHLLLATAARPATPDTPGRSTGTPALISSERNGVRTGAEGRGRIWHGRDDLCDAFSGAGDAELAYDLLPHDISSGPWDKCRNDNKVAHAAASVARVAIPIAGARDRACLSRPAPAARPP